MRRWAGKRHEVSGLARVPPGARGICKTDMDCCSGRCEQSPDGALRCSWAPGCRPSQNRCASDAECCSGTCTDGPPGVGRCGGMPGPMMTNHCLNIGEVCEKPSDCCAGETCSADSSKRFRCTPSGGRCLTDRYPCALSDECCGGYCLPDSTAALSCHSLCAPIGAPCTATDDCCMGACVGSPGSLICSPVDLTTSAPTCTEPGDSCDASNAACCGGTICAMISGGTTGCAPTGAAPGL